MTHDGLLYLDDPMLTVATATVVGREPLGNGLVGVVLDRTPAYPKGGGQPSDRGQIRGAAGAVIFERVERRSGLGALHVLEDPEGLLMLGAVVTVEIDAAFRSQTSRLHTAGELICAAAVGLGRRWAVAAASHTPGQSRVAFDCDLVADDVPGFRLALEAELERLVKADLPVSFHYAKSVEEVAALAPDEPVKAFESWPVRMVSPAPDFWRPCLGAHCSRTGEVGAVTLTKVRLRERELSVGYELKAA